MEEDLVFLRDNSLSLETINDFRIILSRQRKLVLTLFGKEGSSPESEEVKVFYENSEIQEKIADILLSSSLNDDDFSDIKLEAAMILAALTRFVVSSRERLDAVARELIIALRAISENELFCEVLYAISLHCHNHAVRDDLFRLGLMSALVFKSSLTSLDSDITRAILHLLSCVFKPQPRMPLTAAFGLLPILSAALHSTDTRTISYAATAI